jgi:hypothetical protein
VLRLIWFETDLLGIRGGRKKRDRAGDERKTQKAFPIGALGHLFNPTRRTKRNPDSSLFPSFRSCFSRRFRQHAEPLLASPMPWNSGGRGALARQTAAIYPFAQSWTPRSNAGSLAHEYGHLTAAKAAELAAGSGVGQLALTHISGRYADEELLAEAQNIFPKTRLATDFDRIEV